MHSINWVIFFHLHASMLLLTVTHNNNTCPVSHPHSRQSDSLNRSLSMYSRTSLSRSTLWLLY